VPGAATARTANDPCTVTAGPQQAGYGTSGWFGQVCSPRETIDGDATSYVGWDENAQGWGTAPQTCPNTGTADHWRIPGSTGGTYSTWEWDYWVKDGYWILWDSFGTQEAQYDSRGNVIAIAVPLVNWWPSDGIDARIFWSCEPVLPGSRTLAGRAASTSPDDSGSSPHQEGGDGPDSLSGDGRPNVLHGHGGADDLDGHGGDDHLLGAGGADDLSGGADNDYHHGAGGTDTVAGGAGDDDILGGSGGDIVRGGEDDDQLFDDQGTDSLTGGSGNDRFSTRDGDRDEVDCGRGADVAVADRKDVLADCEHVYRTRGEIPKNPPDL
jgi:hypothetical protein